METRYLEQLIMIANSRSMRDAAEKLFLSQAALSHNLKKLETELDCQLFERFRNQLTLNAYGNIMLEHSRRIIEELEGARLEIAEEKRRQAQTLHIGVYAYAFQSFVLPNLANAVKENTFMCHIQDEKQLSRGLAEGSFDVIFTPQAQRSQELETVRLFKEQIMVSMPYTSEYAAYQSVFLSDLAKLELFLVSNASGYTPWFEQVLQLAGAEPSRISSVPFKEYLYKKDGVDQCHLTSSFIIRFLPAVARRVMLPLAEGAGAREIYMIYKKQDEKRLKPLLEYIEKNRKRLFTGSSFLPFFLFPGETGNLLLCGDSEESM